MKYLCQRQHLLSISICWIVWKLFDHINQIQISDKEHSHLGHEMYFTTIGEKCRIWLSAVSVFSSFSYLAVSRWSIKFRWGKFCFYNIIIHILRVRLRDIPASAGLLSSSLQLWTVVKVSEMVVSMSDISRELTITCLQTDLHIRILKELVHQIFPHFSSMIKKLLKQVPSSSSKTSNILLSWPCLSDMRGMLKAPVSSPSSLAASTHLEWSIVESVEQASSSQPGDCFLRRFAYFCRTIKSSSDSKSAG